MEACMRPAGGRNEAARGEGGAEAQVGQVRNLRPGVSRATGSGCSLVGADRARRTLGPRIQLWEARFAAQTLPRRRAMEGVQVPSGFSVCRPLWTEATVFAANPGVLSRARGGAVRCSAEALNQHCCFHITATLIKISPGRLCARPPASVDAFGTAACVATAPGFPAHPSFIVSFTGPGMLHSWETAGLRGVLLAPHSWHPPKARESGAGAGAFTGIGDLSKLQKTNLASVLTFQATIQKSTEGLVNFQELRARFQNLEAPSLPGPIKFPAGISQNLGSTQSTKIWTNGKPLSSSLNQSPSYSSNEPQPLKPQKIEVVQRSKVQKCPDSPGPPGKTTHSPVILQNTFVVKDMTSSDDEITKKKITSSFRDKLWNWEKVSSQKSEMPSHFLHCGRRAFHLEEQKSIGLPSEEPRKDLEIKQAQTLPSQRHLMAQRNSLVPSSDSTFLLSQHGRKSLETLHPKKNRAGGTYQPIYESEVTCQDPEKQPDVKHHQLPKTKPLPSVESLGPPPRKPPKPPVVDLQAFQRLPAPAPKTHREAAMEEGDLPTGSAEFEEPHNYEATISYLRHSGNSINLCSAKEIADSTYEVGIEELKKPWKSFLHQELSPKHADEDKRMEKEPCELEAQRIEKDPQSNHIFKMGAYEGMPRVVQMAKIHTRSMLDGKQDVIQTKACSEDLKLMRHSQGQCPVVDTLMIQYGGYVEALEVTSETPGQGVLKRSSISEDMYDDVECSGREGAKSDFSNSFASDNEENSGEMYEDVYKTKSNYPNLDGKEALQRLQRFFKKEKDRFKMKKTKSKENVRRELAGQRGVHFPFRCLIYNTESARDEDKLKTWKPKFLTPKEKKEKKGAVESESLSPTNFFRIKKQNLKKNRLEKEEKLFREKFEYEKEITVINTAVACSSNSRNGIFDLPITPGEELDVIDVTEENLVICRNSKGKCIKVGPHRKMPRPYGLHWCDQ
ncbi:FYN-binding protein 2, partial [Galemys pyrenaicus]